VAQLPDKIQIELLPPEIKDVKLLQAQPGDIVVVSHPGAVPPYVAKHILDSFKRFLPPNVHVMFLDEGMDIKLLRPEPAEQYVVKDAKGYD